MSGIWFPQQLRTILNKEKIDILSPEQIGYTEMEDVISKSEHVGLTTFNDQAPINIVCLTLDEAIYVYDLDKSQDKRFLKRQFSNKNVQFYLTNGSYNALLFKEKLGIFLYQYSNIFDITVLDLLNRLNQARITNREYIYNIELIDKKGPKQLDYDQLVKYYLGADKLDLTFREKELSILKTDPFNTISKNLILKRASLTKALGEKLMSKYNELLDSKHEDLKSLAKRANNDLLIRYENEKDGTYSQFCHYLQLCPNSSI